MRLKYFIKRNQSKGGGADYYWQCKPSVAEKYGIEKFVSLGKDEKQALIKWQELNKVLEYNKNYLKTNGILPFIEENTIEEGTLQHLTEIYFKDRRFTRLADTTKKTYILYANNLNKKILFSGQKQALASLKVGKIDRIFCKTFYEKLLLSFGNRASKHYIDVLSNIIRTAIDYGYFNGENPCSKLMIEKNKPRDQVWTKEAFDSFCSCAIRKGYIGLYIAMNIAYYTAQRQTDILNFTWDNIHKPFHQSKTGAKIFLPINKIPKLKEILEKYKGNDEDFICIDHTDNKPYNNRIRLFVDRFDTIRLESGIKKELLFRDLRRTAILALDEAGCTQAEIASISGHSRNTINQMLQIYAPATKTKAENAMEKVHNS